MIRPGTQEGPLVTYVFARRRFCSRRSKGYRDTFASHTGIQQDDVRKTGGVHREIRKRILIPSVERNNRDGRYVSVRRRVSYS